MNSAVEPNHGPSVLVIPSSYFAQNRTVGGGERYAFEYARALARATPTTLGLFDLEADRARVEELEVRTFRVRSLDERSRFPLPLETLRSLAEYDLLHIMVFPTPITDLLVLLARLRGRKVVLTDVGGGIPCLSTYLQRVHPRVSLNRLVHGLALLSRHSAAQFHGWRQPQTILYGGAQIPQGLEVGARPEGYALYVGRLLPHKGVLPLIQALNPATPLRVVGRPYDAEYFRALREAACGKSVRFILDADDAEVQRQYLGANAVLQPSLPVGEGANDTSELLGLVTLEGMAHAKPVIVTRTASLPELVVDGETGFVVPPHDEGALRERVELLVSDPERSVSMGKRALRHVATHFTWDQVARRGMDFYRSVDGRPGAYPREEPPSCRPGI